MALRGFKVIELAGLAPAPFCGMILRDHGASVIRIDRPGADPHADTLSRGKRSLILDLKKPVSVRILKQLCSDADVLIDPYRPDVMEKWKLGPHDLCEINPKLIYARLTGFGQSGPYSRMAGHDINYIAISGVLSMLGSAETKPHQPINLMGDFAGGGLVCALGICLALLERHKSGKGQVIDANMVEGSAYVSSWLWTSRRDNLLFPLWQSPRGENVLDGGSHFYQTYKTKDGKYMAVGALEPQFYVAFMKGLGLNEKIQTLEWQEYKEKVSKVFITKTQAEWCNVFDFTDACVTPVIPLEEAHKHPHNVSNNSFICSNENVFPAPAPKLSRTPGMAEPREPIPGEHSIDVLLEAGYKKNEIESFVQQKVVIAFRPKASL